MVNNTHVLCVHGDDEGQSVSYHTHKVDRRCCALCVRRVFFRRTPRCIFRPEGPTGHSRELQGIWGCIFSERWKPTAHLHGVRGGLGFHVVRSQPVAVIYFILERSAVSVDFEADKKEVKPTGAATEQRSLRSRLSRTRRGVRASLGCTEGDD